MAFTFFKKRRVFLDFSATTPADPRVVAAMLPYFSVTFHNPSALYSEGVHAHQVVSRARQAVAKELNTKADTIVFTSGGTESVNMAITGAAVAARNTIREPHIVTTLFEHPAVIETCKKLEQYGVRVTYIAPNARGIVSAGAVEKALTPQTVLVAVMYANNEIGTIQPIREIAHVVAAYRQKNNSPYPYVYTDASQAACYESLAVNSLGVDMLTLDGSKIYGPKGVGILYVHQRVVLDPLIVGGGQEKGRRAGTENVPLIVGFATALTLVRAQSSAESKRLVPLRDSAIAALQALSPRVSLNGDAVHRLPNNVNVCIDGLDAEFAVVMLDQKGIACSSMTSCKYVGDSTTSYVIESLGAEKKQCGNSSLRFTFGLTTTRQDVDFLLKMVKNMLEKH